MSTLTVAELIARLQKMPQDLPVYLLKSAEEDGLPPLVLEVDEYSITKDIVYPDARDALGVEAVAIQAL